MLVSPHQHCESFLTASTLSNMVIKAKSLGREYFSYSDQGSLSSALKTYSLCKKEKIKPVLGLEFYFLDPTCPVVSGTTASRCSYYQASIFCRDQDAYQALVKMVSRTDLPTISIYDEDRQLFGWSELSQLAQFNTELVIGGSVHDMVGKTYLASDAKVAAGVFLKLKDLFGDRLSVALLCEKWDRKFSQVVEIIYKDGSKDSILASDYVSTDKARNIKALDLITKSHHTFIKSKRVGSTFYEVDKEISSVKLHKGYLPLEKDVSLEINKLLYALAKNFNVNVMVTDYAFYCDRSDKIVQELVLSGLTKLYPTLNMKSDEEFIHYLTGVMNLDMPNALAILANNDSWAHKFDNFELKYEWHLAESEGDPIKKCMSIIQKVGRMRWDNPLYTDRLKEEIDVIANNPVQNLLPYFFPIYEVVNHYKDQGHLVGVARGSAGGSLLCFLMGITNLDPIKYNLSFPRFLSLDRIKNGDWPDVDTDMGQRETLVGKDKKSGFLYSRWGNKAANISTRSTIRIKSAIKDASRFVNGSVSPQAEVLTKSLPNAPQNTSDAKFIFGYENDEGELIPGLFDESEDLKKYADEHPKEWDIVSKAMGLTRSFSQHASAYLICDVPIDTIIPTKNGNITQYDAKSCEASKILKYDFLVVEALKDIEVCLKFINKKNNETNEIGTFTHNGQKLNIWELPNDPESFKSIWGGDTTAIFQIHTQSMIPFVMAIKPETVEDISVIEAVVRPGALDAIDPETGRNMAEEYVERRFGRSKSNIPELIELLPETYGTLIFQEQNQKIASMIGGLSGNDAENLRRAMSKKDKQLVGKFKSMFLEGAVKKISLKSAEQIWAQMETSSRYNFNSSHSCSYAITTYATMFLRHNYPLEFWGAIATNAGEREITGKFWSHLKPYFASPDINLSTDEMVLDYANNKLRAKLGVIRGLGDKTADPIIQNRPYKDIQDFIKKEVASTSLTRKLIHVGVLDSLFPPKLSFLEKLKMFEDYLEVHTFIKKKAQYELERRKLRQTEPKEGQLPEEYLNLHPLEDARLKKATLPSLVVGLYDLGARYSKALNERSSFVAVDNSRGIPTMLVNSDLLLKIAELDGQGLEKDIYVAATGYINEISEFSYSNNTKKALKLNLDFDGISLGELVQWPSFDTGELQYDQNTKKGSIITVFFRKRVGRKEMNIQEFVLESYPKTKKSLTQAKKDAKV